MHQHNCIDLYAQFNKPVSFRVYNIFLSCSEAIGSRSGWHAQLSDIDIFPIDGEITEK
jgi:hypothetical protein